MEALACEWPLLEALMGGTPAMRAAKEKFLPKFPNEDLDAYKARLETATLFPAYRRTVAVMAGKPFAKPLTFSAETPVEIRGEAADEKVPGSKDVAGWADDIDREGVNLHTFASEMMVEALAFGLGGILVEAPKPIQGAALTVTRAEQAAAGVRPYFVRVRHNQILGARLDRIAGKAVLTQLRLLEHVTEADGEWGEKTVERVRVLERGSWRLFEKKAATKGEEWISVEEGRSGLAEIPFVPLYGSRLAYMMGASPLLDLAYLNAKHWQSQSDQDTILHVARVPILFGRGFQEDDTIVVGAATAIKVSSTEADLKFVEHTGAAIDAGKASLDSLEDQMIQAGAELLVKKPGARSATESANDAEANKSDLQRITEGFEDSLDQALQFMADYAKLGSGGNVTLYKDFGAALLSEASGQLIVSMWQAGMISKQTAIEELKRRGELSPEVNAQLEAELIDEEGPALGAITDDEDDAGLAA
jgi:hypothetical protein